MNYKRIGKIVFCCSVMCETGAYYASDKKTHTGKDVDMALFSYNVLSTSFVKGLLWPWHVPLITYNFFNHKLIPQYKRECTFFTEAYLDEYQSIKMNKQNKNISNRY